MANLVWFLAALFVAGIASTSGCDQSKIAACASIQTELVGSNGIKAMCAALDKMKKCIEGSGCSGTITDAMNQVMSRIDPDGSKCGAGSSPSQNGGSTADCGYSTCGAKKDCELYKCFTMKKNSCPNKGDWNIMYAQADFKSQYDKLAVKCADKMNKGSPQPCDFSPCMMKKDCAMFTCQMEVKDKCEDNSIWENMYKTESFKKNFDSMKEKCGCGSLKPSLLFVLASAILMFLRSHF